MADSKVSALAAETGISSDDVLYVVSAGTTSKKVSNITIVDGTSVSGTHSGTSSGTNTGDQTLPVKATGAEIDTGTDDAKFATAKALADSTKFALASSFVAGAGALTGPAAPLTIGTAAANATGDFASSSDFIAGAGALTGPAAPLTIGTAAASAVGDFAAASSFIAGAGALTGPAAPLTIGTIASATAPAGTVVGTSDTQTLTNKRVTKRTGNTASSATPTINTDNVDMYLLTAQAEDITSFTTNLSGTPTEGQTLMISITGTAARAITWGSSFEASTVALPTTTVTTARLDVGFIWNTVTSKWRCVAAA